MYKLIVLLARFEIHLGRQPALDNRVHSTSNEATRSVDYWLLTKPREPLLSIRDDTKLVELYHFLSFVLTITKKILIQSFLD